MEGNLIGSLIKNTGLYYVKQGRIQSCRRLLTRSLNTKSWLPSSVKSLIAHPLISRTVSDDPFSPATVDNRAKVFVFFPTPHKKAADVMCDRSCVTSNSPQAPAAFACTTLVILNCCNRLSYLPLRVRLKTQEIGANLACLPLRYSLSGEVS